MGPIDAGGLRFGVLRVAAFHFPCKLFQSPSRGTSGLKISCLSANFFTNNLSPKLLLERLFDGQLFMKSPDNLAVVGQWDQQCGGEVIVATQDDCGTALSQFGQGGVGGGCLRMIDQHEADVFAGDTPHNFAATFENELVQSHAKVDRLL